MLPPGLEGDLVEACSGGSAEWCQISSTKHYTNAFVFGEGKVLLGYKKRGFGKDLWNGFGGKVEPGETPEAAAKRELLEEAGIEAPLKHCGTLLFSTPSTAHAFYIDYFSAYEFTGIPSESDEMRPSWFSTQGQAADSRGESDRQDGLPPIPYNVMWADDEYWFPLLLQKKHFVGRADFRSDGMLDRWWFGTKNN